MSVMFEVGTAWVFKCDKCGAEFSLVLTSRDEGKGGAWLASTCCPFCRSLDPRDCGALYGG
jgi:hypothetical protein